MLFKLNPSVHLLFTAKLPNAADAARCTSGSLDCNKNMIGSSVSRLTARTSIQTTVSLNQIGWIKCCDQSHTTLGYLHLPFSVISANANAAER
jgi:hypothetical protein